MTIPKTWLVGKKKHHLVSMLNDGEVELVVYKYWLQSKQRWLYLTEEREVVEMELELVKSLNKK